MKSDEELEIQIKALNAVFAAKLGERFARIDQVLQKCADDSQDADALSELHRLFHTLAGSAGTFGFDALGVKAREIEGLVKAMKATTPDTNDFARIALEVVALKAFATMPDQNPTTYS